MTPGEAFTYVMESSGQGWKAIVVLCPETMKAYNDALKEIVGFSIPKFLRKVGHKYIPRSDHSLSTDCWQSPIQIRE